MNDRLACHPQRVRTKQSGAEHVPIANVFGRRAVSVQQVNRKERGLGAVEGKDYGDVFKRCLTRTRGLIGGGYKASRTVVMDSRLILVLGKFFFRTP